MIRVLHVDDEVGFLDLVSFFLKREGDFEIDTATTAESALEKMQSENYDAVVVDYSLPGMDGLELLKILRAKGLQIPFVLFTGRGKEETAVQALNCGADFYLQKGANPQLQFTELVNMLRRSVQGNRSEAASREGERFLSSVFSSIQDGISVLDKDLNILRVNQTMEDWYSHKMPLVGKKCYDAYHGRQAQCDSCPSIRTIESGKSAYEVVSKTGPKGAIIGWLDLYSFPMRDSRTGELSGVIEYVRDITDRRKAEVELHGALERYKGLQGIIDKSPVIMVIWRPGPGSPVSFISDSVAQWGYRRDDFVSTLVYDDIIHKEDLEREKEEFRDYVRKGVSDFVQEYRIVTKSGEVRYVEDHTYVRRGSDGNPVLFEGIVIDVTARKTAQQKSEELTSRLLAIVEAFPDLHFRVDAHGTILDFNAGRIADLYVPPQKFLGRKMQEVLPPDVGKMFGSAFGEALNTGRIVAREYALEIEGETRFYEARLAPIANNQILVVVRNITAGKRAEEALRVSESEYRQLAGSITDVFFALDKDMRCTYWNKASEVFTGIPAGDAIGKSFTELFPGPECENVREICLEVLKTKKATNSQCKHNHGGKDMILDITASLVESGVSVMAKDLTARANAEREVRESERTYRELVETISDVIFTLDFDGKIIDTSPSMKRIIGLSREGALGKHFSGFVHSDDLPKAEAEFIRAIEGKGRPIEIRLIPIDGVPRWVRINALLIMRDGEPDNLLCVLSDIHERKLAEEALRERDIQFKKLSSNVPGMIYQFMKRPDGTYCVPFTTEAIKGIFGCSPQDVREDFSPIAKVILPEDLDKVVGSIEYSAEHLTLWQCEYRAQIPGQSVRWLFGQSTPEKLADGSIVWSGFNTDITERKLAEEMLRTSEEKYRQLVDLAQEGIIMTDADVVIRFVNPRMADMLGYQVDEMVGKPAFQFMTEQAAELAGRKVEDRTPGLTGRYELDFLRKDGTLGRTSMAVTPIKDKGGDFSGSLAVAVDVTDRKRYEDALEVANQKLNLLGQVTRHDALNQLAVLMGWLQIAQESVAEPPVQEYLKNMRTAADAVIRQLDFTGDYQKMGVAKPEWIDVKTAFLNGTAGFSPSKLAKSVHVDGLEVYADMMFEKIFHNLVDNSIRHGKKVTEIRVHHKKKGNDLLLFYEDDGDGIPADKKDKLFLRGIGDHTGVGLFMVRAILGITGITIEENGIPGHGVRFEMHVPSDGFRVRGAAESQKR
jgi:PAS domain S-box-containing protein